MVRAWARENGFTVSERGRIPAAVVAAYHRGSPADGADATTTGTERAGASTTDTGTDETAAAGADVPATDTGTEAPSPMTVRFSG